MSTSVPPVLRKAKEDDSGEIANTYKRSSHIVAYLRQKQKFQKRSFINILGIDGCMIMTPV